MDGGGRLLRSLGDLGRRLLPSPVAFAGAADPFVFGATRSVAPPLQRRAPRRRILRNGFERFAHSRLTSTGLVLVLLAGAAAYGAVRGGEYQAFVADNGTMPDILAKTAGFAIQAVSITGARELSEGEILKIGGISPRNSLLFLDVGDIRKRLKAAPLIKEASVSKLYPHRLLIEIEERQPTGLWQKDGAVSIVAADGTPIDDFHDPRYERLPLVVGDGANAKLGEYLAILVAAGELRDRVRAGIYVAGRRWTLKTNDGITIDLPERDPVAAIARLALLEHDSHILERDILSLDLRIPGRVVVNLTPDAGAARAALLQKKSKKKGAST